MRRSMSAGVKDSSWIMGEERAYYGLFRYNRARSHVMAKPYVLTGTLSGDQTVTLDEALPLKSGKVRLTLELLRSEPQRPYLDVLLPIRDMQRGRVH